MGSGNSKRSITLDTPSDRMKKISKRLDTINDEIDIAKEKIIKSTKRFDFMESSRQEKIYIPNLKARARVYLAGEIYAVETLIREAKESGNMHSKEIREWSNLLPGLNTILDQYI